MSKGQRVNQMLSFSSWQKNTFVSVEKHRWKLLVLISFWYFIEITSHYEWCITCSEVCVWSIWLQVFTQISNDLIPNKGPFWIQNDHQFVQNIQMHGLERKYCILLNNFTVICSYGIVVWPVQFSFGLHHFRIFVMERYSLIYCTSSLLTKCSWWCKLDSPVLSIFGQHGRASKNYIRPPYFFQNKIGLLFTLGIIMIST